MESLNRREFLTGFSAAALATGLCSPGGTEASEIPLNEEAKRRQLKKEESATEIAKRQRDEWQLFFASVACPVVFEGPRIMNDYKTLRSVRNLETIARTMSNNEPAYLINERGDNVDVFLGESLDLLESIKNKQPEDAVLKFAKYLPSLFSILQSTGLHALVNIFWNVMIGLRVKKDYDNMEKNLITRIHTVISFLRRNRT